MAKQDGGDLQILQTSVEPLGGCIPTSNVNDDTPSHSISFATEVRCTRVMYSQSALEHLKWPEQEDVRNVRPMSFLMFDVIVWVQA